MRPAWTISVAQSNQGQYHIARLHDLDPRPICRHRPPQRERQRHHDESPTLTEAFRKWENTVHPDLRCTACTSEARRQLAQAENGRIAGRGEGLNVGPDHENRGETP